MSSKVSAANLERFTTFGDLLKFLRRRVGLTQRELSAAVGYSHAQISRLELNQRLPDITTVSARLVPALDLEDSSPAAARLLELAEAMRREDSPASGLPPYKGLQHFDEADGDLFFGREALLERLLARLQSTLSAPGTLRFLGIVGASGSGKSSIVRAGLIPAVRWNPAFARWLVLSLTPTAHPLDSLARSLSQAGEGCDIQDEPSLPVNSGELAGELARQAQTLQRVAGRLAASNATGTGRHPRPAAGQAPGLLLFVDQFEELFTLCRNEAERQAFIANLLTAAAESGGSVLVVVTLRADFYASCAPYAELRQALAAQQEYIGPMSAGELRRAIEEPAQCGGWQLEPGLADVLLKDVGAEGSQSPEPGALPLLSHALLETWRRRRGRTLTLSGYLASGGVRGAIAETADVVFHDELDERQQAVARGIFLRLCELGEEAGGGDTRRRASFAELVTRPDDGAIVREVLTRLADARLITTDDNVAEVAHEALIREWPVLRGWLEEDREGLRLHRHLTLAAEGWERQDRDPGELCRGLRLGRAQAWAAEHPYQLNPLEQAFLEASQALAEHEQAEREAQRQRELDAARALAETQRRAAAQLRRRALYLTGALILALFMAGLALFLGEQTRQAALTAQGERRIAFARELAAASLNNLAVDPERSILLALQAVSTTREVDGTVLPEAEEALHRAIVASPVRLALRAHGTRVLSAAFSPDGQRLATLGDDGTAIVWDAATGSELLRLPGTTEPGDLVTAQRIAYSPDGQLLAACDNQRVVLYSAATGEALQVLAGHQAEVTAVAFSRDGARIASADSVGSAFVWDVTTGASLVELRGHTDAIEGLTFSPDGQWLVTSGNDATMKFWDVTSGALLRDDVGFTGLIDSVAFSPDGTRFAFTTVDGLHVWQLDASAAADLRASTPQELLAIPDGASVTFSPDGQRLAAASGATQVKVWEAATGREVLTLVGHTGWVMGVVFSPDGKRLATTSLDGTARIWSLTPGVETVAVTSPGTGYGTRVAYNPSGQEFATNGGDGTATLWNAQTGAPRLTLAGHALEVLAVAFSADGERLATGSLDATAIVWDTGTGQKLLTLLGHQVGVRDVAFSPDGRFIATGGFDRTARIWDAASGAELQKLTDHAGLVVGVAFGPDSTRLATASTDTTVKVWDVLSGALMFTLTGHTGSVTGIAYSPDGLKIATGSPDATAKIWDANTGQELLTLAGHSSEVRPVAFSPDGQWLVTGSGDNTAIVWDVATGQALLALPGSSGGVYGVAFSPLDGGAYLAVASNDGLVRVFTLRVQDLIALAHTRVTRQLAVEECRKYLHLPQCPPSNGAPSR
jgi:WD40 repeat protein/transcriptional regulator with XRE-family HTH domain